MRSRLNIGIYISPQDTDIAAWFNLLRDNHLSHSKWIVGLLCAYAMDRKLPIGTVNIHAPLVKNTAESQSGGELMFGAGDSQEGEAKRTQYKHGWQIRGPHREYIQGSVINVSVSRAEIRPVLEESWKNGHHLSTFVKALIRENLEYGNQSIPPKMEDLQKICSAYLVLQNSIRVSTLSVSRPIRKKRNTKKGISTPTTDRVGSKTASETPISKDRNELPPRSQSSLTRKLSGRKASELPSPVEKASGEAVAPSPKVFHFDKEPDTSLMQAAQPLSKGQPGKNPLLDQI